MYPVLAALRLHEAARLSQGSPCRSSKPDVANGFANEPCSTAWHGASLVRIMGVKIPNQGARLATARHGSA
jgi:hypothetical protein